MGLIEGFTNVVIEENKEEKSVFKKNMILIILLLIKLFFIYIVMLLWPRVMPSIFPSIVKQPKYISLLGLSVILSLLI